MLNRMWWWITHIAFEKSMIIQNLCLAACCLILYWQPDGKKKHAAVRTAGYFLLLCAAEVVCGCVFWGVVGKATFMNMFIHGAVLILAGWILCRYRLRARLIMGISFYAAEISINSIAGVFAKLMPDSKAHQAAADIPRNAIILTAILVAIYLRRWSIEKYKHIPVYALRLTVTHNVAPIVLSGVVTVFQWKYEGYGNAFILMTFLGFLSVSLVGYYMLCCLCQEYNNGLELQTRTIRAEGESDMRLLYQKNRDEMRKIRHDLKNHFAYMRAMIENGEYEKLEGYFSELDKTVQQMHSAVDCGNPTVNVILNMELVKLGNAGIRLETKLAVPPALPFPDSDLCSLLTNLLDNAVEACQRFQIPDAVVELGMRMQQEYLYICVTNPVPENAAGKLLSLKTFKADKEAHGYGSMIIDDIVRKYNGAVNRSVIDGRFVADVMLELVSPPADSQ